MAGYIGSKAVLLSTTAATVTGDMKVDVDTLVVDSANNRVGIGTSSPSEKVEILHSSDAALKWSKSGSTHSGYLYQDVNGSGIFNAAGVAGEGFYLDRNSQYMYAMTASAERMRIDSSGNLLVGKTVNDNTTTGVKLDRQGYISASIPNDYPLILNRQTSDGDIAVFRKNGSTVGSIGNGNYSGSLTINSISDGFLSKNGTACLQWTTTSLYPAVDDFTDIGLAPRRYDDVYATNGTIQTSDRNEKQDIEALSDAEQRVAVAAKGLLRKYRWKDAVAKKGDAARIHFGIIAQDLQAAFEAEGLDAGRYGMFISSTWWEAEVEKAREVEQEDGTTITETYTATETYDEPTEGATERTRLGVRYPELLAFIIAAL